MRGIIIVLFLGLAVVLGFVAAVALMTPANLSRAQEQVLGLTNGGIVGEEEQTFVTNCVQINGQFQAVRQTRRVIQFANGARLETTFSDPPQPSDARC